MIYKRKESRFWYAAFYVKGADGRLVKRAFSTKTEDKAKARDIERQLKSQVEELREKKRYENFFIRTVQKMTGHSVKRPGLPLSQVWEKFLNDPSQSKRTERTMRSKHGAWENFLSWLNRTYPDVGTLNDVSREIAQEYMRAFKDKSASTFNNNKNSLSSIWQVLMISANLQENIWRLIKGAEDDSVSFRDFSSDEVGQILRHSKGFWRYSTLISFYSGLRLKDVAHLRKSQINDNYISLVPAKTRRKRKAVHIWIHPTLKQILEKLIAESEPEEDYLFPDAVRDYKKRGFQTAFGRILDRCGIKEDARGKVGFHSLRHTFVTINEALGLDRKVIQGIVGHGSPVMTGHYSHDMESIKAIEKMPVLTIN